MAADVDDAFPPRLFELPPLLVPLALEVPPRARPSDAAPDLSSDFLVVRGLRFCPPPLDPWALACAPASDEAAFDAAVVFSFAPRDRPVPRPRPRPRLIVPSALQHPLVRENTQWE